MNKNELIDLRNLCEPNLTMILTKVLHNAHHNECLHFVANDSFIFRQVSKICIKQGHFWRAENDDKTGKYFQIRVGKPAQQMKSFKYRLSYAA